MAEARAYRRRTANLKHPMSLAGGARLEDIFAMVQRGEVATLNLVVKADVQGSLEALTDSLRKLDQEHEEVRLSFVHRAVGGINESDINLASVSNATVIGFNVRPDRQARELAAIENVEMRLYEVIYQVLEDVQSALLGMLKPEFEEVVTGDAEVREVFSVPRVGKVAGCFVRNGTITRGSKVRFLREGVVIWNGAIASLRRFKDDVREVQSGFECGIGLENYQDLKPGDVIETYDLKEIARDVARSPTRRPERFLSVPRPPRRGRPVACALHASPTRSPSESSRCAPLRRAPPRRQYCRRRVDRGCGRGHAARRRPARARHRQRRRRRQAHRQVQEAVRPEEDRAQGRHRRAPVPRSPRARASRSTTCSSTAAPARSSRRRGAPRPAR